LEIDQMEQKRLLGTQRWRNRARHQLMIEPMCRLCAARGIVRAATVADHIVPHKNNPRLFDGPLQSLCKSCHDRSKRAEEGKGYLPDVGVDGCPIDPNHPANRGR
jgi:5-methylcytosine-specific restriction enzyme A